LISCGVSPIRQYFYHTGIVVGYDYIPWRGRGAKGARVAEVALGLSRAPVFILVVLIYLSTIAR